MLIDTHAHLNFNAYKNDTDEVIHRALENNVWVINVGSTYETSKKAVGIAERYPEGVYATIGLHPIHLETGLVKIKNDLEEIEVKTREEEFDYKKYRELAKSQKVVAIGEIGLDYYWRPKTTKKKELFKQKQKDLFLKQLELAKELNLPVIFHCRLAHDDLITILTQFQKDNNYTGVNLLSRGGVIHCFTGTWEQAKKYLKMGFYLGFNGLIFKNIKEIKVVETSSNLPPRSASPRSVFDEIIKKIPLEKILIETDCPYLTPPQENGRNEPLYVKYIAEKIAEIKNLTFDEIAKITTENAKNLFKI